MRNATPLTLQHQSCPLARQSAASALLCFDCRLITRYVMGCCDCVQVELFVICKPEQSDDLLLELVELEKALYSELGLHCKVLDMPTGDLGAPAHRKIDFEVTLSQLGSSSLQHIRRPA